MKNLLLIIFLSGAAALSFIMVRNLDNNLESAEKNAKVREVVIGHNVKARYFDANNQIEYIVDSDKVTDLSSKAGTYFKNPHVNYFENMLLQWTMTAKKGYLTADKNEMTLTDDVDFLDSPLGSAPLLIKGSVMYYHSLINTISSDELSVINNGIVRQESARFSLDTRTKIIDFDEAIKGRYKAAVNH